jgi:hypothetical protein
LVTLVFFGGGALVFIANIASRRVALRIDASAITLGGSPGTTTPARSPGRGPATSPRIPHVTARGELRPATNLGTRGIRRSGAGPGWSA